MTEGQRSCAYEGCDRVPHKTSSDGHCIFHAKAEDKTIEDFREALKDYLDKLQAAKDAVYNFVGFIFPDDINFSKDFGFNVFKRADFTHATFKGDALFEYATFERQARFQHATFEGNASFWYATFEKYTSIVSSKFEYATFEGEAQFQHATFTGRTSFWHATFKGDASFDDAIFEGDVQYWYATFKGGALFGNASFERYVTFGNASFERYVTFGNATFKRSASFGNATFKRSASFDDATFEYVEFNDATFRKNASISPRSVRGGISFGDAIIENIVISPLHLKEEAQIDFAGARLRNTNIRREDVEGHIKQKKSEHYREARDIYMLLKNNFRTIGKYDDESWAFLQEKEMERRSFFHYRKEYKEQELGQRLKNRSIKDSLYCLFLAYAHSGVYANERMTEWSQSDGILAHIRRLDRLFPVVINLLRHPINGIKTRLRGYCSFLELNRQKRMGEVSPRDLFKVFWFYMKYPMKYAWSTFLKWLYGWGERPWLIFIWCGITIFIFSGLYSLIGDITLATNATMVKSYLEKLYFSGITFTTLGFGGYSPIGGAKVLAFIESFLGIFSIALFVYSFARRTAGR